jgi:hypothetical protein
LAVKIVNPIPLPLTGSVTSTVTGTVGLASGASVQVNNTVTDPVRVRNVNDAIQPFQAEKTCSGTPGCLVQIVSVPAGKRAVIEYFSGQVTAVAFSCVLSIPLIGERVSISS